MPLLSALFLTLMAGRPLPASADENNFVRAAVLKGEKLSSRSTPAQVTHEIEDALTKKGYVRIGELTVKEVTATYWDSKQLPDKPQLRDVTTPLLRKAAEQGGDLVILLEDNSPLAMEVTKKGKALTWDRQSRQEAYQYKTGTGDPGHTEYRTVYYNVPTSWEIIKGTENFVRSSGSVWRYDPELAARISPKLEAERQKHLQRQENLNEAENQASLLLQQAEQEVVLQRRENDFFNAVAAKDLEKTNALLAAGADVNAKDDAGMMPLHYAVTDNSVAVAKQLLAAGAAVNSKSGTGMTPLHIAAMRNAKDAAELLLANGADMSAKSDIDGTPLHYAAMTDAKEVAELLLAKGADVSATVKNGRTPLHLAAYRNEQAVAKLLLAKGADVNAKDNNGDTPLALAEQGSYSAMVQILREHGAKE